MHVGEPNPAAVGNINQHDWSPQFYWFTLQMERRPEEKNQDKQIQIHELTAAFTLSEANIRLIHYNIKIKM